MQGGKPCSTRASHPAAGSAPQVNQCQFQKMQSALYSRGVAAEPLEQEQKGIRSETHHWLVPAAPPGQEQCLSARRSSAAAPLPPRKPSPLDQAPAYPVKGVAQISVVVAGKSPPHKLSPTARTAQAWTPAAAHNSSSVTISQDSPHQPTHTRLSMHGNVLEPPQIPDSRRAPEDAMPSITGMPAPVELWDISSTRAYGPGPPRVSRDSDRPHAQ